MIYTTPIKQEARKNMEEDFQNWDIPRRNFQNHNEKLILEPHGNYEIQLEYQDQELVRMMGDLKYLQKPQKHKNQDEGEFYNWLNNTNNLEEELEADIRRDGNYLLVIEDQELQLLNSAGEQQKLKDVQTPENEILAYMWEAERPGTTVDPEERGTLHLIPSRQTEISYKDAEILQKTTETTEDIR